MTVAVFIHSRREPRRCQRKPSWRIFPFQPGRSGMDFDFGHASHLETTSGWISPMLLQQLFCLTGSPWSGDTLRKTSDVKVKTVRNRKDNTCRCRSAPSAKCLPAPLDEFAKTPPGDKGIHVQEPQNDVVWTTWIKKVSIGDFNPDNVDVKVRNNTIFIEGSREISIDGDDIYECDQLRKEINVTRDIDLFTLTVHFQADGTLTLKALKKSEPEVQTKQAEEKGNTEDSIGVDEGQFTRPTHTGINKNETKEHNADTNIVDGVVNDQPETMHIDEHSSDSDPPPMVNIDAKTTEVNRAADGEQTAMSAPHSDGDGDGDATEKQSETETSVAASPTDKQMFSNDVDRTVRSGCILT